MSSAAPADHLLELVLCPECEAAVSAGQKKCWLCGHLMDSPFKGTPRLTPLPAVDPADSSRELVLNVSLAAGAAVLAIVTAAVWAQEPVYGVALAFVLVPALAITLLSGLVSRLRGRVMTPLKRLAVFCTSFLVMLGMAIVTAAIAIVVVVVMILAMFIALLEACFKMVGGG